MNELLELAVSAHGGLDRWKRVRSIDVSLIISGQLLEVKGFPEHQNTRVPSAIRTMSAAIQIFVSPVFESRPWTVTWSSLGRRKRSILFWNKHYHPDRSAERERKHPE
jgi:hypothetical protein